MIPSPASGPTNDSWKTPELREAESALDRSLTQSRELLKKLDKVEIRPADLTASDEAVASLKAEAEKGNASEELRALKRKVDAGELSWKDVAEGKAFNDPDVRRMVAGKLGPAQEAYQEFEEGATLDEVIDAASGGDHDLLAERHSSAPPPPPQPPAQDFSADPLGRSHDDSPSTPPPPPAPTPPPPPQQQPPPPYRGPAPDDDYFTDPLAEDEPSAPPSRGPEKPRRAPRKDDGPDDDDYFSGTQWRG